MRHHPRRNMARVLVVIWKGLRRREVDGTIACSLEKAGHVVNVTVRFGASRCTYGSPDSLVVCNCEHKHDNTEVALVVVVHTAAVCWFSDGSMLAVKCSTDMRKVPSISENLSYITSLFRGRWGDE